MLTHKLVELGLPEIVRGSQLVLVSQICGCGVEKF